MVSVIRCLLIKKLITPRPITCSTNKMSTGNAEFTAEFFDESSRAWMENKVRRGESMAYKCEAKTKAGKVCLCKASMKDGMAPRRCMKHKQTVLE
jgi:hypothetical protein